jgi:hypothetical protein
MTVLLGLIAVLSLVALIVVTVSEETRIAEERRYSRALRHEIQALGLSTTYHVGEDQ